jgi:CRISPR-associated protein Cas2
MLDSVQLAGLKDQINKVIDRETDSVRYYNLGNLWHTKVEHVGAKQSYDPEGFLNA